MHDAISKQTVIIKNTVQNIARIFWSTLRDLRKYTNMRAAIYADLLTFIKLYCV